MVTFVAVQAPVGLAETVEAKHEVLTVAEEQLIDLAMKEKFTDLTEVMSKLVQLNLESKQEKISLAEIHVVDFKYKADKIIIYYQLD